MGAILLKNIFLLSVKETFVQRLSLYAHMNIQLMKNF